jgi:dCTP deaminase
MIMSYNELRSQVQNIMMTPVPDEHVNAASIDVTLGPIFWVESLTPEQGLGVLLRECRGMSMAKLTLTPGQVLWLMPGQFVLAATAETFNLPLDVSAEFRLKSSAARIGLSHALAVWADPGWHGSVLTLELHNITQHHSIGLQMGDRVGQMIFHKHAPVPLSASYAKRGAYNNDRAAQPAKPRVNTDINN